MRETRLLSSAALPWIAFLAVALAPLVMSSSWTNMAILTLLFIHLCIAWNLVGGIAGQFCIGHSLFLAAGAYTSTLLSIHLGITPWIGMFAAAALTFDPAQLARIPKDLPIYLLAGDQDPSNGRLERLTPLVERYRALGIADVTTDFYPGGRHEMLNETNRDEVVANLKAFVERVIA